ncbi:7SK snRNA methylphosphate capping enzyme [Ahaetulla prasina]|uniref:7SK snRNA methylphosphate capping enzyme n=1 Tax=Ahaetulla prasina TaxID=499056 RepID=UPI002649543E|nr:7SK snRNA methylphosphate capping enzyme [Ahaetulla prasina]
MIEMATDKETFLVPAPPPPLLEARAGDEAPEEPPAAEDPPRREEPASEQFQRPRNGFQAPPRAPGGGGGGGERGGGGGKRRNSCHVGGGGGGFKPPAFKRRRRVNSECDPVLPSEFLLGGNIFDPLNLNSLLDEEVNQALNAETPKSSPLPAKGRDPVEILIPKDITDPLSLNAAQEDPPVLASPLKAGRKRHRHRGNQRAVGGSEGTGKAAPVAAPPVAAPAAPSSSSSSSSCRSCQKACNGATPQPYELNTAINCRDEVVSPLLPEGREQPPAQPASRSTAPPCPSTSSSSVSAGSRHHHHHHHHHHRKRRRTCSKSEGGSRQHGAGEQPGRSSPEQGPSAPPRSRHLQASSMHQPQPRRASRNKFQYGNYCKYYGYRNPNCEDVRLRAMKPEWFRGREVLDIGCNVGHLTLSVAKKWGPARMVGLDIDGALIHSARQNIRHYLSEEIQEEQQQQQQQQPQDSHSDREGGPPAKKTFPASLTASRGPIAAPRVPQDGVDATVFPNNVIFVKGNYVLDRDELLEAQKPEYDVILCLSVTKWVQLNWGDEGLKRLFKRTYRHLRPGGIFILEPQAWSSYKKRKNLTETISRHYHRIKLKPDQFPSYLTSSEVGFSSYELVAMPRNTPKGFQRPICLFRKGHPGTH